MRTRRGRDPKRVTIACMECGEPQVDISWRMLVKKKLTVVYCRSHSAFFLNHHRDLIKLGKHNVI